MRRLAALLLSVQLLAPLSAQGTGPMAQGAVEPVPGAYAAPLTVTLAAPPGATLSYRFLETPSRQVFPAPGSVVLDALSGETRTYTLRLTTDWASGETQTRDYRYEVVRAAEPSATVVPVPGFYTGPVALSPQLPDGWTLWVDGVAARSPVTLDVPAGQQRSFLVEARGALETVLWPYTVDRRDQEAVQLEVVSPAPGVWDNAQALVVVFEGVDEVSWNYGGVGDASQARPYEGPILLERTGAQVVTVTGRSRVDGSLVQRTVAWSNGTAAAPAEWPASGLRLSGLELPELPGWLQSWDEGRSWSASQALRQESSSSSSRKLLALQIKKGTVPSRYVWWLDARLPLTPTLTFYGGWNPRLAFSGSPEALHRVSWTLADGRSLEGGSLWGPVGSWKVPDGVIAARVAVQGLNGQPAPPATLGFAETGWSTPGWEAWDNRGPQTDANVLPLGGKVPTRAGFRAAYEVSDRPDVPEPAATSPWLEGAFFPSVPWGADRTFYARFAWRDAAGLTGPASAVVAVRVDRVPPLVPEVIEAGGQLLVKPAEGEEAGVELFWALTPDRAASAEALTFAPYRGALSAEALRSGATGKLWFHAQAQDRSGNPGPARLNVALAAASTDSGPAVVQVDPDPSVGETAVIDGGVYPWPQFRLRALEQGRDLWVGVTDGALVPADWKVKVQPWTGVLSRAVGRGERRTFLVFWNAKTTDGWAWAQPKSVTLTLDQGPPASPLLSGTWPSVPLGTAWTLDLKPGRTGDTLRYTVSTDGSNPSDPGSGATWPGTRTWDAPLAERLTVRLRMAAVSVSGLTVEVPVPPVVLDRTVPAAVTPPLEPFTYRTSPLLLEPPGSSLIRYTLTTDGSVPAVPGAQSPVLARAGLPLDGVAGKSTLYRFRWRPYSSAGLPGPVGETYAVLIDRTSTPLFATPVEGEPESGARLPRLTGFPSSGISATAVTLEASDPAGLLRYEVREGVGSPRPVTALSPRWTGSLVLDGGPGVDRSYAVAVRGFSPEGRPITAEATYVLRIDRSIPRAPEFELVADPRRAEGVLVQGGSRNSEEVLHYRWFWVSFPQGSGELAWSVPGGTPPRFVAPGGALTRLRAQAYLSDEAGNEGPVTERNLLIDQNVVYVAPAATGDGSRARPLGSIVSAVDLARRSGKTVVLTAAGSYPVARALDLGGLQVYGGLGADSWETSATPGRSQWLAEAPFTGTALLESGERDWSLSRVDLATGNVAFASVVAVRGADVEVKASTWTWSGAQGGWDQAGGSLTWTDVSASVVAEPQASFLELSAAKASVRNLSLAVTANRDGVLFTFRDVQGLFQDLAVVSKKAVGFEGVWSATGSRLTVNNARFLAGDGASRTNAFILRSTDAVFFNTDISLYAGSSNTGFQVTGGRFEAQKSNLSLLRGDEFNQGFVLDHCDAELRNFVLKAETGAYQGGFNVDGGSLTVASGRVQLAGGGQRVWGAQFLEPTLVTFSDVHWVLGAKTPGELWKVGQPWKPGSTVTGSQSTGW